MRNPNNPSQADAREIAGFERADPSLPKRDLIAIIANRIKKSVERMRAIRTAIEAEGGRAVSTSGLLLDGKTAVSGRKW